MEVWQEYCAVMQPRHTGLGEAERGIIRDALKVATIDECKGAIRGCKKSAFHMGANDSSKKYNKLSQILKGKRGGKTTREQIDMFLEILEGGGQGVTSAGSARVTQARRDVLDGHEFPGDENVQERANEAKAWLESQGWRIEPDPDTGRPMFHPPA